MSDNPFIFVNGHRVDYVYPTICYECQHEWNVELEECVSLWDDRIPTCHILYCVQGCCPKCKCMWEILRNDLPPSVSIYFYDRKKSTGYKYIVWDDTKPKFSPFIT